MSAPDPAREVGWSDPRSHLVVGPTGSGKTASSHVLAAVAQMQRNPSMPTVYCRVTEHGPMTGAGSDALGTPLLRCSRCGAAEVVTEDQVRLALGAAALPPVPLTGMFGKPVTADADPVPLRRAPLRIDTAFGSVRAVTASALVAAAVAAFRLAPIIGAGWALIVATMLAVTLDVVGSRITRHCNRKRTPWLPGHDLRVDDLNPGTWIETPLNLRASPSRAGYAPRYASRVRGITGLPESPQTGYLALTLEDGRRYTVPGDAPVRTLHLDHDQLDDHQGHPR